jgi:hypothetical protein
MKISEVKKSLKNKSYEKFKSLGFKKYQFGINKKVGNYEYYIGFGIVDSDNSFPTTFHFGISSRYLNNILRQIFIDKELSLNSYCTVYGTKQTRLFDDKQYPVLEYDIYTEEDIDNLINDLYKYYVVEILPFLEKLTNIDKLSKFIISEKVLNESMYLPNTLTNGIILSKLTNNTNYEQLKNNYTILVKDWAEWDIKNFNKVLMFLEKQTQEELLKIAEGEI